MIIDAKNLILGRLASFAAKKALLGEDVIIINSELAVLSGGKADVLKKYKQKTQRGGPLHGPFIPKTPARFVKRVIRGMLPYQQEKGRKALKRIKCFEGTTNEYKKGETVKEADVEKLPNIKYITVKKLCSMLK